MNDKIKMYSYEFFDKNHVEIDKKLDELLLDIVIWIIKFSKNDAIHCYNLSNCALMKMESMSHRFASFIQEKVKEEHG